MKIKMKYYILDEQQKDPMTIKNGGDLLRYIDNQCDYDSFALTPLSLNYPLEVYAKSKMADVMAGFNSFKGLLISNRLKDILEKFNLPPNKCYSVSLKHKNITNDNYYWIHILMHPTSNLPIDFPKSQFFKYDMEKLAPDFSKPFFVKNMDDWMKKKVSLYEGGTLFLLKSVIKDLDLFAFRGIPVKSYIITERLKNELLEQKVTGITIREAPWIQVSQE